MPELGKATYVVEIDTREFERDMGRAKKRVDRDTKQMDRDMQRMARGWEDAGMGIRRSARDIDVYSKSADRASRRTWQWDNKLRQFSNTINALRWPAIFALGGPALQGLTALVVQAGALGGALTSAAGGAVSLAAAFMPLIRASSLVLNGLLGIATAASTLFLGFNGVFGALSAMNSELSKSGVEAQKSAKAQRTAADQVKGAEEQLAQAHRSVTTAQEGLHKARREAIRDLVDLRFASAEGVLGEKRAALALSEARAEAAKLATRGSGASGLEMRGANLSIAEAELGLKRARTENKRAQEDLARGERKGVRNSEEMVSARRQLFEATRDVSKAEHGLLEQQRDSAEAMEKSGSAANTLAQKMAELPPAAQKFVKFLFGMKPRLDELRQAAAQGMFPGMERGLSAALGSFGKFKNVIGLTGKAIGNTSEEMGRLVGSKGFGSRLEAVGIANAKVMRLLGRASVSLTDDFSVLAKAGAPLTIWIGRMVDRWAATKAAEDHAAAASGKLTKRFQLAKQVIKVVGGTLYDLGKTFINVMDAGQRTGMGLWRSIHKWSTELRESTETQGGRNSIERYFQRGAKSLRLVGRLFGNLFHTIVNVGSAGRESGMKLLGMLNHAAEGWKHWTESIEGRNELKQYFDETRPAVVEMGKLVAAIGSALVTLSRDSSVAGPLKEIREDLLPALTELLSAATKNLGHELIETLVQLTRILGSLSGTTGGLKAMFLVVNGGLRVLNQLLSNPLIKQLASWALAVGALMKAGVLLQRTFERMTLVKAITGMRNIGVESETAATRMQTAEAQKTVAIEKTNVALEKQMLLIARSGGKGPGGTTIMGGYPIGSGRTAPTTVATGGRWGAVKGKMGGLAGKYGATAAGAGLLVGGGVVGSAVGGRTGSILSGAATGAGFGAMFAPESLGLSIPIGAAVGALSTALIEKAPSIGTQFANEFVKAIQGKRGRHIKMLASNRELGGYGTRGKILEREEYGETRQIFQRPKGGTGLRGESAKLQFKIRELKALGASDEDLQPVRKTLRAINKEIETLEHRKSGVESSIKLLGSGVITTMKDIHKLFKNNLGKIDSLFPQHGKRWRHYMVENMESQVVAIKRGMIDGTITAKTGIKQLEQVFRKIRLFKSEDPMGIAKGFRENWRKAGEINRREADRAVDDLSKMKPKAREAAQDMMVAYAKQLEKSGKLVEGSASRLRSGLVSAFGQTKQEVAQRVNKMSDALVRAWGHGKNGVLKSVVALVKGVSIGSITMSEAMAAGLKALGTNVNKALQAMGVSKKLSFSITKVGTTAAQVGAAMFGPQLGAVATGVVKGLQASGEYARGGHVTRPMYMVGEEAPRHNEWVVATNPQYRKDNLRYWAAAGADLGVPGFAKGGKSKGSIPEPQLKGPGPLREGGQKALHRVAEAGRQYVQKHRPKAGPMGSAMYGPLGSGAVWNNIKQAIDLASQFGLSVSSLRRPGDTDSYHSGLGGHQAVDLSNGTNTPQERRFFLAAIRKFGVKNILEMFYDPMGYFVDNYATHPGSIGGHEDHVHIAFKKGGLVPGFAKGGLTPISGTGTFSPEAWGSEMALFGFPSLAQVIAEGLGIIRKESNFNTNPGGDGAHFGAWQEDASFGSVADRLNPRRSTEGAARRWKADGHSFYPAWGRWQLEQSGSDGAKDAPTFMSVAKRVVAMASGLASSTPGGALKEDPMHKGVQTKVPTGGIEPGKGGQAMPGYSEVTAATAPLHFPAGLPNSVDACNKELTVRRAQLTKYKHAYNSAKQQNDKTAIKKNVEGLESRIRNLIKRKAELIRAAKRDHIKRRISQMAEFGFWNNEQTGVLPSLQRAWEAAEEYASRVVDVEPIDEGPARKWVTEREEPAFLKVLGIEKTWRNNVLTAENSGREHVDEWSRRIKNIHKEIETIQAMKKSHPQAYEKQKSRIPELRTEMRSFQEAVKQTRSEVIPGWESMMRDVQGPRPPAPGGYMFDLSANPDPDAGFGGYIWDTQMAIKGLGLKFDGAGGGESEQDATLKDLYKQLATEARQREAVLRLQMGAFQSLLDKGRGPIPAFGGVYHSGGIVPGRPGEERMIRVQAGEIVSQPSQIFDESYSGNTTHVDVIVEDGAVDKNKIKTLQREAQAEDISRGRRRIG